MKRTLRDRRRIAGGPVRSPHSRRPGGRPVVPGGPAVAEAAAQSLAARIGHRRRGRCAGSHLGRAPRLRLDDRAHGDRRGDHAEDVRRVLRAGAAGARVRRGGQRCVEPLGRTRRQVRVAGVAGRHRGRRERIVWITAAGPPEIPGSGNATARAAAAALATAPPRLPAHGDRRRAAVRSRGGTIAATGAQGRGGGRGAAPPKPQDAHVLKFSRTGEFLLQIGKAGRAGRRRQHDRRSTGRRASTSIPPRIEVYVADGFGNHRVVVFDAATGAYKRHWVGSGDARSRP